jgi:hypothetical protein
VKLLLTQLACLAALGGSAWAAGWLAWGRRRPEHALHPFAICVGLALVGQAGLVLAAAGQLRPPVILAALVALHVAALPGWRRGIVALWPLAAAAPRRALAWAAVVLAAAAPGLLIGLYPPHAFDETTYHLPFARALAASGSLPYLPHLRTPVFPQLAEALQATLLLAAGDTATHVVSLLATLLAAALLLVWGREEFGREAGWLAAGLLLGSPLVAYLAGTGYVEPLLALFTSAALYAATRREPRGGAWAVAAGVLAGSAGAVKYLGLLAVGVAALPLLRGERRGRRLAAYALAAAACALPTYAWIGMQTGNPLHPFYANVFGRTFWAASTPPEPLAGRALRLARLPVDAVWNRDAAGRQPPLSPAFLLGMPLLVWAALRRPALRPPLALLGLALAGFLVVPADARYLAPWLPLWSLALGAAAASAWGGPLARRDSSAGGLGAGGLALLALGLLLPGALYGVFYAERAGAVPTTREARQGFLSAQVPGYASLAWLAGHRAAPATVYVLYGEQLHGIAPLAVLGEHTGPHAHRHIEAVLGDPPRLAARLRAFGATHLLLLAGHARNHGPGEPPGWLRRVHTDGDEALWEVASPRPRGATAGAALLTSPR